MIKITIFVMEVTVKVLSQLKDLNSRSHFQEQVRGYELLDLLRVYNEDSGQIAGKVVLKMREEAIVNSSRHKYVGLKWLIFVHQVLQVAATKFVVETIMTVLQQIQWSNAKTKFEEYLLIKLIKPYHQYLKKMGSIVLDRVQQKIQQTQQNQSEKEESSVEFKKQRKEESIYQYSGYRQYNLINFACEQLSKPVSQFYGFFNKHYPSLNGFICLINRDIRKVFHKLKIAFNQGKLPMLTYLQLQNINNSASLFSKVREDKRLHSWILTETQTRSQSFLVCQEEMPETLNQFQQNSI